MLRSKSRSRSIDFGPKNHYSSVFSRTLSASKICRGDGVGRQVDATALKLVDKKSNSSENNQVERIMSMQQQMRKIEEELRTTKEKLSVNQVEKSRVVEQLGEAKRKENQGSKGGGELMMEVENLKRMLASARDEVKAKDKKIGNLEVELGKVRQIDAEKDGSLGRLVKELRDVRERENGAMSTLSENKRRIQELEAEVERKRSSESRMADSLAAKHEQLDSAMFDLEESKIEIASLHEKIDGLEDLCHQISREEEIKGLNSELAKAQEAEKEVRLRADAMAQEMALVKKEWRLAVEGEEKSTKAMEDLALALQEVATEANQAKEKLNIAEMELQRLKEEAEKMKEMMRVNDERHQKLLLDARNEAELYRNAADRLRVEAEETVFAWNGKEIGFVSCIKRAEEERAVAQHENQKLSEQLQAAREETYKLRDILKQAVNEANAAKAAAAIAREENSSLKDVLSEKEEALHFITRENERLRISEAAAQENVKQLKKLLTLASSEFRIDELDPNVILMFQDATDEENESNRKQVTRAFSFNLEDLKFMNESEDEALDEDPEKAEALKGSIFDSNAETPKSEVSTPKAALFRRRMYSAAFKEEEGTSNSEDFDQFNTLNEDTETDKHPHRRSKTMFQRVGGLLTIRKGFHRKEPSGDLKTPTGNKKELPAVDHKTPTSVKKEPAVDQKTPTSVKKEPAVDQKTPTAVKKEPSSDLKSTPSAHP